MRTITAGKKSYYALWLKLYCTMICGMIENQWKYVMLLQFYLYYLPRIYQCGVAIGKYKNWLWFKKALNQIIKWIWCVWQWPLIRLHAWGLWSCSFDALRPTYLMSNCRNHTKCITPVQYINDKQLKKQWHK